MAKCVAPPKLKAALPKLTKGDTREILRHIVILPMIEVDKSLSQEELGDAFLSGKKTGFTKKEVMEDIKKLVKQIDAVIEKD